MPTARTLITALVVATSAVDIAGAASPFIVNCPVFPADSIWNARVDHLPVLAESAAFVASIGADEPLWPDFASGLYEGVRIGIPFAVVPPGQPMVEIVLAPFQGEAAIPDESDLGPAAIPADAPIEGGPDSPDDRHVLVVQQETCVLTELYKAVPNPDGSWNAASVARFDLTSHALRQAGWTSADAAGLPIFPGLVRWEEVAAGEIAHALRFTARRTRQAYVWLARHYASEATDPALPAMGQRFRLKASFDISGFSPSNQVILRALKTYGMILADNGSPWFLNGAPNDAWNNDDLARLRSLKGSDFEAVDASLLMREPNSGAARFFLMQE